MTIRVAAEDGLDNVKQALRREGIEVTKMTTGQMSNVNAAVVTGGSNNFLGIAETQGNQFPVIEASGLTAQEIVDQVKTRSTPQAD